MSVRTDAVHPLSDNIRKFENLVPMLYLTKWLFLMLLISITLLVPKRMEERLRYLKNYWVEKVKDIPKVKIYTSLKPQILVVLLTLVLKEWNLKPLKTKLFDKYKIVSAAMEVGNVHGVRITPHLYITTKDLDRLVTAINDMAKA